MIKTIVKYIVISILTLEAKIILLKYKPKIVGVTGNAGKTGTKEAVSAVLSSNFMVWKNEKSYNGDIGIPLTILHCSNAWSDIYLWLKNIVEGLMLIFLPYNYPEWLVLEIGADKPGDIKKFTSWVKPKIVIVTTIGKTPVHIENFSGKDALIKEKFELVKALRPGGYLILNADDPEVLAMKDLVLGAKVITYGFSPNANLRASNYHIIYSEHNHVKIPSGINFKIDYLGNIIPVKINSIVGRNNVYSAIAGITAGVALGLNFVSMLESIARYERPVGRLKLIEGIEDSIILDDTYNSSPAAVSLALESLTDIEVSGQKIVVLGDMLELGKHTIDANLEIGKKLPQYCDRLITVGQRAKHFAEGALDGGMDVKMITCFDESKAAGKYLRGLVKSGDLVLVKGSQGIRMERVVEQILLHSEDKNKLLVRQDPEWLIR
ncbi:MAG: UDP-N-acetylmuramoyl-tripeptide--D-alanyl-D-alanine ligase [Candidatus Vogelbacteria bacterium]|nr:UDP-N-acetylmuramoyl-tripeptide--D-alanyl-D-alanine ligase [Candidatus Vogelbacteria bacterium]